MSDTPIHDKKTIYQQIVELLPGLLVIVVIGLASSRLGQWIPRLGDVTIAILLGVLVGNLFPKVTRWNEGVLFGERRLLPLATALLGVELQLMTLVQSGFLTLFVILISVATSILLSVQLGSMMGYSRKFSLLIGAGNGICGSSAIAATSTVIHAEEKDIGISISVVNLLGTVGIFLLPAIVNLLSLTETQGGLLIGGSLQAVGQVVAAGFAVGTTAGAVATAVKMGRVLMLGPIVILLSSLMNQRQNREATKSPIQVPLFIVAFFALSILASLAILPPAGVDFLKSSGRLLLVIAMSGIGMRIQLQTLFRSGPGALLFGLIVWFTQITLISLLVIIWG